MILCWDASALVKLVRDEPGRHIAVQAWEGPHFHLASTLAFVETTSALARLNRAGQLARRDLDRACDTMARYWQSMHAVSVADELAVQAAAAVHDHGLKDADAVHLATATRWGSGAIGLVTWDRALHAAAVATGLAVVPAQVEE